MIAIALRVGISPRAIAGLFLVVAIIILLLGVRFLASQAQAEAVPVPLGPQPEMLSSSQSPALMTSAPTKALAGTTGPATLSSGSSSVTVHVVGQVRRPGVVVLPAGSRVRDALSAVGGLTDRANPAGVNLARPVLDGEQIMVPRPGELLPVLPGPSGPTSSSTSSVIDLNSASVEQLDTLPGVGPVIAERIVQWRHEHGRFSAVDELNEVSGIGSASMERIRPLVRV